MLAGARGLISSFHRSLGMLEYHLGAVFDGLPAAVCRKSFSRPRSFLMIALISGVKIRSGKRISEPAPALAGGAAKAKPTHETDAVNSAISAKALFDICHSCRIILASTPRFPRIEVPDSSYEGQAPPAMARSAQ